MSKSHYVKGQSYLDLKLNPAYVNDSHTRSDSIVLQYYNSIKHSLHIDIEESNKYFPVEIHFSQDEEKNNNNNLEFSNFQLITDLFDIILTEKSDFINNSIKESQMIRDFNLIGVLFSKDNKYIAKFNHLSNNKQIILISNPASQNCRTLFKKRQRLNEYL